MAEAAVEDRPPQRFYCHVCNVRFEMASPNFICPHCSNGFVEELQDNPSSEDMVEVEDWEDDEMDFRDLLLSSVPNASEEQRRGSRTRLSDGNRVGRRYGVNSRSRIVRPRTLTRLASSNLRQNVPFENLIQDFIINLGVGVNFGNPGNMQVFLGNPGDYAWGREGLDAIVTQLLNQMDSTGPPPLSKEVIDALPTVEVSREQVDSKLQCSVCWEPFLLDENVRQLPCQHVYHEPCIRPWLELHGTCPICRQNLGNNEQTSDNQDSAGSSGGGTNTYNILRGLFQTSTNASSANSASSTSSGTSDSTTSRSRSTSNNSDSAMM